MPTWQIAFTIVSVSTSCDRRLIQGDSQKKNRKLLKNDRTGNKFIRTYALRGLVLEIQPFKRVTEKTLF